MTKSAAATHVIPAGLITHSTVSIKGQLDPDITVHHARTPDARIGITLDGIQMSLYNCHTAQGLLEAFVAARGQMVHIPAEIPTIRNTCRGARRAASAVDRVDPAAGLRCRGAIGAQQAENRPSALGRRLHRPNHLAIARPEPASCR